MQFHILEDYWVVELLIFGKVLYRSVAISILKTSVTQSLILRLVCHC